MKRIVSVLLLAIASMSAVAEDSKPGVYLVRVEDCSKLAQEALAITQQYEEGVTKPVALARLNGMKSTEDTRFRATAPILEGILDDLYEGKMAIPSSRMKSEVYDMCYEQRDTTIPLRD